MRHIKKKGEKGRKMADKQEWEELEKWYREKQEKNREEYGFDKSVLEEKKPLKESVRTTMHSVVEMKNIVWIILVALCCILIFFILNRLYFATHKTDEQKVIDTAKSLYGVDCSIVQKEELAEGKDKYTLQVDNQPEMIFQCVKTGGGYAFDYTSYSHQHYFEQWESEKKEQFVVEEDTTTDGLLEYRTYIPITVSDFYNIESKVRDIGEFVEYAGENYSPFWNVYLAYGESRIYPYTGMPSQINKEEAVEESKRTFVNYIMKREPEKARQLYSTEILDTYWKPTALKVVLNGQEIPITNSVVQMYYSSQGGEYALQLYTEFVKQINGVEIISRAEMMPREFTYEGHTYTISNQDTNLEKYQLGYTLTIQELEEVFHAKVELDKEEEKAFITIP